MFCHRCHQTVAFKPCSTAVSVSEVVGIDKLPLNSPETVLLSLESVLLLSSSFRPLPLLLVVVGVAATNSSLAIAPVVVLVELFHNSQPRLWSLGNRGMKLSVAAD
ncbi:hypothetical protein PIB30_033091 [Stylosanthes scabra]|uniref:Uncharacterized protein n=1 Tax=Stylosanthes scabra TaxID=79078 RepID=A0ABU6RCP9_9FABA|nr:hypothetical protein [Stylosanthes scabra]